MHKSRFPDYPVVERPVILEFKRAQGMCDILDRVLNGVRVVVHGINAPLVARIVMGHMSHSVEDRISHVHIGTCHVDLRAQSLFSVSEFAVLHFCEEFKVFLDTSVPVRVIDPGLIQSSAVFPHLLRSQVRYIGLPFFDKIYCDLIHLIEVVGGKKEPVFVISSEPRHVLLDGLHKFALFLCGISVVKTEVKFPAVLLRHAIVEKNALSVAYMQIAVRLGGKTRVYGVINAFGEVLVNFLFDEMAADFLLSGDRRVISVQFFFTHCCSCFMLLDFYILSVKIQIRRPPLNSWGLPL